MLAVSAYHLVRVVSARRPHTVDVDATHLAMGVAMAAMLAGRSTLAVAPLLALGFAVPTLWFAARAAHGYIMSGSRAVAGPLGAAVGSAAMVYMLAVAGSAPPMAGMPMPAGSPVVAGLLVVVLVGACLPALSRPSIGVGCQVAMSATAAYMLVSF